MFRVSRIRGKVGEKERHDAEKSDKQAAKKSEEKDHMVTASNLKSVIKAPMNTHYQKTAFKVIDIRQDLLKGKDNDASKLMGESVQMPETVAMVGLKSNGKSTDGFPNDFASISSLLSHNIGFSVAGGLYDIHLKRNTRLPCANSKYYTTAFDGQRELILPLYTGERPLTKYCVLLGKLCISKIPRVKAGEMLIEVTFYVDEDETLKLTAIDKKNQEPLPVTLELNQKYKPCDANMVMDALTNKTADMKLVSLIKEFKSVIRDVREQYDYPEIREEMNEYLNRMTKIDDMTHEAIEELTEDLLKRLVELDIKI